MDAELMQLVARFKLKLLRTLNVKVDTYRFIAEEDYAMKILQIADQSEDEGLILLALQLAEYQGLIGEGGSSAQKPPPKAKVKAPPQAADAGVEDKNRYMFGARG